VAELPRPAAIETYLGYAPRPPLPLHSRSASSQNHGGGPSSGRKGWKYLTDCLDTAGNYENGFDEPRVILQISTSELSLAHLGPDDDDVKDILSQQRSDRSWYDLTWRQSLELCSQCTYASEIPPRMIAVLGEPESAVVV
jgi:hypothetical protein